MMVLGKVLFLEQANSGNGQRPKEFLEVLLRIWWEAQGSNYRNQVDAGAGFDMHACDLAAAAAVEKAIRQQCALEIRLHGRHADTPDNSIYETMAALVLRGHEDPAQVR